MALKKNDHWRLLLEQKLGKYENCSASDLKSFLRQKLLDGFESASTILEEVAGRLKKSGESVAITRSKDLSKTTFKFSDHTIEIKIIDRDLGFEIILDGKTKDTILIHYHLNSLVLNSSKKPADPDEIVGRLLASVL